MMLPYLSFLGLALPVPALILLAGIWFGSTLAEKHAGSHKVHPEHLYNLIFTAIIAGLVGARLSYVLRFPAAFLENPGSLLSLNFGLFDPLGGAVVAILAAAAYGQRKGLTLWPTLDALTPGFAVLMLAAALANFASGNAYGAPSELPWAIELWGEWRHPAQLYEALAAGGILFLLWPTRQPTKTIPGSYFLQFVTYTAFARLVFEAFRGSSPITILGIRSVQLIAWGVLAAALQAFARLKSNERLASESR